MRLSHLADTEPGQPGATMRTGKPCIAGIGSPFMAKAISVCRSIIFQIGTPREITTLSGLPERWMSEP